MNLSKDQARVVQHGEGALLVVAGPGSGKTRVLTERVRRLVCESDGHFRVLALTFTNKAANEMRERLKEIPDIHQRAFIGTLHSFCMEVLTSRGQQVGIDGAPNLFEQFQDRKQVLRQAMLADPEFRQILLSKGSVRDQDKALWQFLDAISDAKGQLLLPDAVEDSRFGRLYLAYDQGMRASRAIDYDDLLLLTYRLFLERPKIAGFYRRLYRYICIDEAQDLNEAQYRLLQALCGSSYRNLMMVGDPKQAIFQWNGAHPKYLDLFERDFEAQRIALNQNFRSSAAVVEIAVRLSPDYEVEGEYPIAGEVTVLRGRDEEDEARQVIAYLLDLQASGHADIEGEITLDRCAILGRNRYVFNRLEPALSREGWTYYKHLSTQQESESDLLEDFEICLRLLANPGDRLHLEQLLNRWRIDVSESDRPEPLDCSALMQQLERFPSGNPRRVILEAVQRLDLNDSELRLGPALDHLAAYADDALKDDDRAMVLQDISQWRKDWDRFVRRASGLQRSLRTFLGQIALGATQQPREDGLALLTVHSAKGLEFDVVVIMGMMEGVFPDYRAAGSALDEERRNLFVAATRSKRLLCFSYAEQRMMPWGSSKAQIPSRFLQQLGLT
ncbi:ATP-dependent helicase [Thiorhodococcus mannitoliphagus]|uniref:DNA 3'-5' helicase n=1 Tax=Thiorhodococcus mannitoliphagus TaxID=329406 RepID=A0A6P1DUC5_9GAMM|nr:ATP-dependent helicase [Thiorhodococcus mannitoliphagus]NEX20296.1 ATP-dependent helicase [Thiorhodococcus mannitoliphagus]